MKPCLLNLPLLLLAATLGACKGDSSGGQETSAAAANDVTGFYTYADPVRGASSLGLLGDNRFMLVTDPGRGAPWGTVGWYVLRGRTLHLSGENLDAEGVVDGDIIRLRFGQTGSDAAVVASGIDSDGLPFQRESVSAPGRDGTEGQAGSPPQAEQKPAAPAASAGQKAPQK